MVQSDQNSIQQAFVQGNLSATNMTTPSKYPTKAFEIQALSPGDYELTIKFDFANDYKVNVFTLSPDATVHTNSTTYYLSSGQFELDIDATFDSLPSSVIVTGPPVSPWDSFVGWIGKFGQAFPLWVKVLYLAFGMQFFVVGGLWVRREDKKKEASAHRLDYGEKAYLWLDIVYKFLVASFVAIVAIMFGELLILFILRFMFLVSLNLLSLWDLFVIGFGWSHHTRLPFAFHSRESFRPETIRGRVAMQDELEDMENYQKGNQESDAAGEWWRRFRVMRWLNYVPLRVLDKDFAKWRKSRISPRKFRKIQQRLDRLYSPSKFSAAKLIGREKEYNLLLDSFRLHVLKHPMLKKWFGKDELPKAICLTGESGTGKTFLTMVSLKQMLLEAHSSGVLVSPIIIKGSDVFSEYYGRSTKQLGRLLEMRRIGAICDLHRRISELWTES